MNTRRTLVLATVLLASLTGCKPSAKTREPAPLITPPAEDGSRSTLQLDPSKPIVIAGWWDNGRYLMDIEYDYRYRILDGPFPDSSVVERGRWTQKNHFVFTLEPYEASKADNEQVVLSLDRGQPIATIKGLTSFRKLEKAPSKLQQMLAGTWSDQDRQLMWRAGGDFVFEKQGEGEGIKGQWRMELLKSISYGDGIANYELGALVLETEDASADPIIYSLERRTRGTVDFVLVGEGGTLRKMPPADPGKNPSAE